MHAYDIKQLKHVYICSKQDLWEHHTHWRLLSKVLIKYVRKRLTGLGHNCEKLYYYAPIEPS